MKKTWRGMASAFVAAVLGSVPFVASVATLHASAANAANPAGSNSVAIGNFNVYYPDGWSTLQSGRLVVILNVSPDQQAALGDRYVFTPQVNISTEQRLDNNDALKQLDEIATGAGASVTRLTIDGSPAIQWRNTKPWPQVRGQQSIRQSQRGISSFASTVVSLPTRRPR